MALLLLVGEHACLGRTFIFFGWMPNYRSTVGSNAGSDGSNLGCRPLGDATFFIARRAYRGCFSRSVPSVCVGVHLYGHPPAL